MDFRTPSRTQHFSFSQLRLQNREVVSGSGRSAQKSEKLAYFEPISEPQFEEKIGIFFKKCGIFLIRRLQFLQRSRQIPEVVVPTGELSTPDEKSATFFEKKPKFSLNSTRFLGSKVALFLRKIPLKFCGLSIFLHSPQIFCGLFRKRKLPLSTPKNESNLTRNWDIFEKMWLFPHSETAILPLERLPWGSASSYRRIAVRG